MFRCFNDFTYYINTNKPYYFVYSPTCRKNIITKNDENIPYTNLKNLIIREGGKIKAIDIYELEKLNRTINLVEDLEKDTEFLKIPSKFVISKINPLVSSYCLDNKISLEPDYDCLIAFILNEKKKNNSLFNNYFKTLPHNFSTFPINYNQEEKELLKESFLFKRLIKFEKDVNKTFKSLIKTGLNLNYSEYLPIYLLIQSRSFGLDTTEKTIDALVPFADMFNTSLNPKPCFWYFDDENNFIAQSTRAISKGEEINIRYNEGYNTDYLLYYGFTIDNNQNGHIYDFEIKLKTNNSDIYLSEENKSIYFTDLNFIPSLKYLNIRKFRKFYENFDELDEKLNYYSNV